MWVEDYPANPLIAYYINCGDYMYAQADTNYSYSNQAYEYVEDITIGYGYASHDVYTSNGSTAEWITERYSQYNNGSIDPLADFHSVTFLSAQTLKNNTWQYVGQTNHNYIIMCYGGWATCGWFSTQLAHPGSISSNGYNFTNYWDAGGGVGN